MGLIASILVKGEGRLPQPLRFAGHGAAPPHRLPALAVGAPLVGEVGDPAGDAVDRQQPAPVRQEGPVRHPHRLDPGPRAAQPHLAPGGPRGGPGGGRGPRRPAGGEHQRVAARHPDDRPHPGRGHHRRPARSGGRSTPTTGCTATRRSSWWTGRRSAPTWERTRRSPSPPWPSGRRRCGPTRATPTRVPAPGEAYRPVGPVPPVRPAVPGRRPGGVALAAVSAGGRPPPGPGRGSRRLGRTSRGGPSTATSRVGGPRPRGPAGLRLGRLAGADDAGGPVPRRHRGRRAGRRGHRVRQGRAAIYELGRLFLDPQWHRQGIGKRLMALLFAAYPRPRRWTLDTPIWNRRTRAFYEGLGFLRRRRAPPPGRARSGAVREVGRRHNAVLLTGERPPTESTQSPGLQVRIVMRDQLDQVGAIPDRNVGCDVKMSCEQPARTPRVAAQGGVFRGCSGSSKLASRTPSEPVGFRRWPARTPRRPAESPR